MNKARWGVLLLWGLVTGLACAEDTPRVALTTSYSFTAWDGPSVDWQSQQSATLGLAGRWGQSLNLEGQVVAPFTKTVLTADGLIRQLALTWNLNSWSVVTFGKQRLKWGTSRVFSAIDGLEPSYDPLHPQAILDGVTGVKTEWLPNDWLSLSVLALPTPKLKDTKWAARADVLWDEWDLSAGAIRSVDTEGNHATVYADFARFFDRFGVYGEAQLKDVQTSSPRARTTAGFQIEFPVWLNGTLRWLTEYHYNGEGKKAGGSVGTYSYHYGYLGLSGLPVTEKLTLGASLLVGLDTGFGLGSWSAHYEVDQNLSVDLDWRQIGQLPGTADTPNELATLPQRDQVTLTVSASY